MQRVKLRFSTLLLAVLLAVLVSYSALMCLAEAFSCSCDRLWLLAACGISAVLSACAMVPRKTWIAGLCGAALWLALAFWLRLPLLESAMAALFAVTDVYSGYFSGISAVGQAGNSLLFLAFLSFPLCWLTAWTVCREGNALFLLLICLPILLLCLIIVDIAPVLWLVIWTFAMLVLLLSHAVRERSAGEGSRLAWWLLLPTVILVTAITVIWPPADYSRADWSEQLREAAEDGLQLKDLQDLSETVASSVPRWNRRLPEVDLSRIGPKAMTGQVVLESRDSRSRYYLRGTALGVYDDNTWRAVEPDETAFAGLSLPSGGQTGTLEIYTARTEEILYTTYYLQSLPETAEQMEDTWVRNGGDLREYTVDYGVSGLVTTAAYDDYVNKTYTQIPEELRAELQQYLAETGWNAAATPEELADFVRGSAVYDLETPRMPYGEEFVLYFLRESNRGYCVHFATATVMLLRTMGIPARYVTGYSVSGPAGQWVVVTEDDAHAWVEYYVNGMGWVPLEPTPAAPEAEPVTGTAPEQTEPVPEQPVDPEPQPQPEAPNAETPQESAPAPVETFRTGKHSGWLLLLLPAVVLLIWLRRWIGLRQRRERCRRGHPNRRAMAYWRWLVRLARQEGTSMEEELICLAEKARFSQHTLSEEELALLQQALEQRIERLRQYPAGKQLWFRYGLILY